MYNALTQPARVDLHTHTYCSDGRLSPRELVHRAAEAGLAGLAITDHDTIDAWDEGSCAAAEREIELVAGVEITAFLDTATVHLLGYFFDPENTALQEFLAQDRVRRRQRAEAIVARLHGLGVPLSFDDVLAQADGGSICRPHIARAMLENGFVDSYREAFIRYIGDEGPAYVSVLGTGPEQAIRVVHEAGGITSIAHPGQHVNDDMLEQLIDAGIDGIEAIHPSHDSLATEHYRRVAETHDLVVTGGSDFHGHSEFEDQRLGHYAVSRSQMDDIRGRMAHRA